ncbi:uncharacterized protein G2W53_017320 [Senna tora]|uniref:Uncharacterized protein n=1 Tax=Senna tora TaxID=362788 RepID=A0A834TSK0_9FABA|nr:uncharacterized protein G2W53_017320 [Senna tora]
MRKSVFLPLFVSSPQKAKAWLLGWLLGNNNVRKRSDEGSAGFGGTLTKRSFVKKRRRMNVRFGEKGKERITEKSQLYTLFGSQGSGIAICQEQRKRKKQLGIKLKEATSYRRFVALWWWGMT